MRWSAVDLLEEFLRSSAEKKSSSQYRKESNEGVLGGASAENPVMEQAWIIHYRSMFIYIKRIGLIELYAVEHGKNPHYIKEGVLCARMR